MDVIMECKNVTYSYPLTKEPAIKKLDFQIERGKFYGVVGEMAPARQHFVRCCVDLRPAFIKENSKVRCW